MEPPAPAPPDAVSRNCAFSPRASRSPRNTTDRATTRMRPPPAAPGTTTPSRVSPAPPPDPNWNTAVGSSAGGTAAPPAAMGMTLAER